MTRRDGTRAVRVGAVAVGGGAPVSVQTMLDDDPHDEEAIIRHLERCAAAGADIVRVTIPDVAAAGTLAAVRRRSPVPIVSDIHFDVRAALAAIAAGTDALRLNPGNIGGVANVREVARAAKAKGVPIRIGVNLGSLERDLAERLRADGEPTPARVAECLVESALRHLKLLEDEGFRDVVISVKASNVAGTLAAYRLLAERTDCPLHVGLTEAGTFLRGTVHSSVALGALLAEGIGDTIRVSLTDAPEREVRVGLEILRALGMRPMGPSVTSCPTCGRTRVDVKGVAERVEEALGRLYAELGAPKAFPHVAVMGCAVNGPGEAKGADVALCGGRGEFLLFVDGEARGKLGEAEAVAAVVGEVRRKAGARG